MKDRTKQLLILLAFLFLLQVPTLLVFLRGCKSGNTPASQNQAAISDGQGTVKAGETNRGPSEVTDASLKTPSSHAPKSTAATTVGNVNTNTPSVSGAPSGLMPAQTDNFRTKPNAQADSNNAGASNPLSSSLKTEAAAPTAGNEINQTGAPTLPASNVPSKDQPLNSFGLSPAQNVSNAARSDPQNPRPAMNSTGNGLMSPADALRGAKSQDSAADNAKEALTGGPVTGSSGPDGKAFSQPYPQATGELKSTYPGSFKVQEKLPDGSLPENLAGSITLADLTESGNVSLLTGAAGSELTGSNTPAGLQANVSSAAASMGGSYASGYAPSGSEHGESYGRLSVNGNRQYASKQAYGQKHRYSDRNPGKTPEEAALGQRKAERQPTVTTASASASGYSDRPTSKKIDEETVLKLLLIGYIGIPCSLILLYLAYEITLAVKSRRKKNRTLRYKKTRLRYAVPNYHN